MDAKTCLQKLQYVGVLAFATTDAGGNPQVRNISAIHYEPDAMYFFTARGKDFCQELLTDGRVQILGYTRFKEMIRLSARAVPVAEDQQKHWMDVIFQEQPYLSNVYPGTTREIGIVFAIRQGCITPGQPYKIAQEHCLHCGNCREHCPVSAVIRRQEKDEKAFNSNIIQE